MQINIANICENCCKQFNNNFKNCGYCGTILVDRGLEIPLRVLEIIIGYIKYDKNSRFNRDIFSISLVCSELFNSTYCENSIILRKIYPGLDFKKIDKIYNLKYIDSYFNFFYMLKKYFKYLNVSCFDKTYCLSKSNMIYISENDIFENDILESMTNKKLTIMKDYPRWFQINMCGYDAFKNFLKISHHIGYLNKGNDFLLDCIDKNLRYYYTHPYIKCNNCSNREYFPNKIMRFVSYDIPYCDNCIIDKCKLCGLFTYIIANTYSQYIINDFKKLHLIFKHHNGVRSNIRREFRKMYIKDLDDENDYDFDKKYMIIQNHIKSCSICR